jgi:hypothetical protein
MKQKKSKQKNISSDSFPFTETHLARFKRELDEAGGFDELMFKKKALGGSGTELTAMYHDIDTYKKHFLTEEYESLQEFYDTEIPYSFWSTFYETLRRVENKNE